MYVCMYVCMYVFTVFYDKNSENKDLAIAKVTNPK